MPFNLLLLPLLGGYIFARRCYPTRHTALRSENHKLLFVAAEFGVYLLILAALLRFFFNMAVAAYPSLALIDRLWHQIVPFEYSGVAFASFFLGHLSWFVANRYFFDEKKSVDNVIKDRGDPLEMLLRNAVNESRAVIVTLKTGKVYVGHVLCNFNPAYDVQSVKILTIMSGYRKAEDKNVIFNIDYGSVLRAAHAKDPKVTQRDVEDLGTVIPLAEITSVGLFSLPMYKQFFATLNTRPTHDHP